MRDSRQYFDDLKRRVGKKPFTDRVKFTNGKAPCPFHGGDAGFDLFERDGMWFGSCHSACNKKWDAIEFVKELERVDFETAVRRLGGRMGNSEVVTEKPKAKAITDDEWQKWGLPVSDSDITIFSASRKDKTASAETFARLGCRVKDGLLGFPYRLHLESGESKYFTIKTRPLTSKEIKHEHCVNSKSLFNLDTVNGLEPVYVVEGEPDVAILEENGFRAVSVQNANHNKFEQAQLDILCEASHIFLMGDQKQRGLDDPGENCMRELAAKLPRGKFSIISFSGVKDACALASKYGDGFAQRVEELSEDALIPWVSKNIDNVSSILNLPEPKWVIENMLLEGGVTLLCGTQGSQKTLLALALCRAVSNPIGSDFKFLGREIRPHARREMGEGFYLGRLDIPVLYIDRENPPAVIGNRLRRMGLVASKSFLYWGDGKAYADTPEVTDLRLEEWMKETGGLIVFDSLQDWYGDAKEIDNSAMVKMMHAFRRLARLGAGVVILHHVAKGTNTQSALESMKSFYRGGTGIVSIPEMSIGIVKNEDDDTLTIGEIRFRQCPEWQITAKVDWEDGRDSRGITLSLVEDLDWKELKARRSGRIEEKRAEKQSKKVEADLEKARRLEAEVSKNSGISYRKLSELTDIRRPDISRLLALLHWKYDGTAKEWRQEGPGEPLPFSA